ncbi:hypothetical protein L596_021259 [Steinernema carpocapsae]|uniref:Uncharacterized protein n=1 Tax=Steinernema carpocapsae TaxID=34508 RepID=A0A4U5MVX5_STECR|nr:hypothetical protein L596_021259 [Steinernema carpocapsae]
MIGALRNIVRRVKEFKRNGRNGTALKVGLFLLSSTLVMQSITSRQMIEASNESKERSPVFIIYSTSRNEEIALVPRDCRLRPITQAAKWDPVQLPKFEVKIEHCIVKTAKL